MCGKVIGRLKVALAFFSVVAINQIFPQQRRQIILICAAKLAIFLKKKKIKFFDACTPNLKLWAY